MKKLLLAGASLTMFLNIVGSALAADMPLFVAPGPVFSWTSCFLGAHAGGGWAQKEFTDPVALVQNSILSAVTTGVTTVGVNSSGFLIGGQIGCDYQFGFSPWGLGRGNLLLILVARRRHQPLYICGRVVIPLKREIIRW